MKTLTTKRFFRVFFLFLAMISTLLLTACGGGGSDNPGIDQSELVGTWFLNTEDELPVKGDMIPTMEFASNLTCSVVDYEDMTTEGHESYWECKGEQYIVKGTWDIRDGLVKITAEGDTVPLEFNHETLILRTESEINGVPYTSISVYKKTKYVD